MLFPETPNISELIKNMEAKQLEFPIRDYDNNNFKINFILKENYIQIKCNPVNSNEKYIKNFSLEDWRKLNDFLSSFRNIKDIYNQLEKLKKNDFNINKQQNQIRLTIIFQNSPVTINIEVFKENNLNELKQNEIIEEYKILKDKNEKLEKRIEILEDFINMVKLSLPFNSFDLSLYELEYVFKKLDSKELISKKEHLGLINSGVKKLFKKNISECILIYKFIPKDNNDIPNIFREYCEGLDNVLIILKTMNNKIFGSFYNNNNYNNNNYKTQDFGNNKKIFDTRNYSSDSFIFSFDKNKIYYSDIFHKDSNENPGFLLNFNYKSSLFYGNEFINNLYNKTFYNNVNYPQYSESLPSGMGESTTNPYMNSALTNKTPTQFRSVPNNYGSSNNRYQQIVYKGNDFGAEEVFSTVENVNGNATYSNRINDNQNYDQAYQTSQQTTTTTTTTTNNSNNIYNYNNINYFILSEVEEFNIYNFEIYNILLKK